MISLSKSGWIVVMVSVAAGCRGSRGVASSNPDRSPRSDRDSPVGVVRDFMVPESVRYDQEQDVYFVSSIVGFGSDADGHGLIHRVRADDLRSVEIFAQSGEKGVALDAPKGMAIQGDTLWVADIHVLRGFDRHTGRPIGTIDFAAFSPVLLNDVALAPDGTLRVTDTGILMTEKGVIHGAGEQKIFAVASGRAVSLLAKGTALGEPNGITWDAAGKRWIVVGFTPITSDVGVFDGTRLTPLVHGTGKFDGVESLSDGRILYSSWSDSSVHMITGTTDAQIIRGVPQPADIGIDTKRGIIAIPLAMDGRVEFWRLPAR